MPKRDQKARAAILKFLVKTDQSFRVGCLDTFDRRSPLDECRKNRTDCANDSLTQTGGDKLEWRLGLDRDSRHDRMNTPIPWASRLRAVDSGGIDEYDYNNEENDKKNSAPYEVGSHQTPPDLFTNSDANRNSAASLWAPYFTALERFPSDLLGG